MGVCDDCGFRALVGGRPVAPGLGQLGVLVGRLGCHKIRARGNLGMQWHNPTRSSRFMSSADLGSRSRYSPRARPPTPMTPAARGSAVLTAHSDTVIADGSAPRPPFVRRGYPSNSGCARPRWDSCVSLRARVPPSRVSHRAARGRFAPATVWLPAMAGNLTQIDTPSSDWS